MFLGDQQQPELAHDHPVQTEAFIAGAVFQQAVQQGEGDIPLAQCQRIDHREDIGLGDIRRQFRDIIFGDRARTVDITDELDQFVVGPAQVIPRDTGEGLCRPRVDLGVVLFFGPLHNPAGAVLGRRKRFFKTGGFLLSQFDQLVGGGQRIALDQYDAGPVW